VTDTRLVAIWSGTVIVAQVDDDDGGGKAGKLKPANQIKVGVAELGPTTA